MKPPRAESGNLVLTRDWSNATWPFIQTLIAPVKSALGVIMISKNTHCPTGGASVEAYPLRPDSPACGPSAGALLAGLHASISVKLDPSRNSPQTGFGTPTASNEASVQMLNESPGPNETLV